MPSMKRKLCSSLAITLYSALTYVPATGFSASPARNDLFPLSDKPHHGDTPFVPFPTRRHQVQDVDRVGRDLSSRDQKRCFDSIDLFHRDITRVMKDLRGSETDSTVPELFRRDNNGGPSFSKTWTLHDWQRNSSRRRYLDYILTFGRSRMLQRILPQLTVLMCWSILAVWLSSRGRSLLYIPLTPLSLVSTFVAALLTLRSNQGLDRLAQGRAAMRSVLWNTRHIAQVIASSVYPRDNYLALKALRHVALFAWMLKNFMREDKSSMTDSDIVSAMLVPGDAAYLLKQRKKPVAIVTRLRQIFAHMSQAGQLSVAEQLCLDKSVQHLNECITTCERIRASPIPPLYTAHTGLLLTCYLFFLPLALQSSDLLQPIGTVITSTVVGYAMLGLDEISHILEQPFKLMPLYQQSKTSMMDVADEIIEQPPKLNQSEDISDNDITPAYW